MNRLFLIVFMNLGFLIYVYSQLNETIMVESFDFEAVKDPPHWVILKKGDWVIEIRYSNQTMQGVQKEYAPARDFYVIQKDFHQNGIISSYVKALGSVAIGERRFYDETGKLIKVIDEDAKFGNIKPGDMVCILEKIGWINRKTGENTIRDTILPTDGNFYRSIERNLNIIFVPAEYDEDGKEIKPPIWTAFYMSHMRYDCIVDGNTGEYRLEVHSWSIII